jgi:hypothetical protein
MCTSHTFLTKIYPLKLGYGIYTKQWILQRKAHDASIVCYETPCRDCLREVDNVKMNLPRIGLDDMGLIASRGKRFFFSP